MPLTIAVIDRLIARGVTIDAYTVAGGFARAVIREEDLKLFANLPELLRIAPVNYVLNPRSSVHRLQYAWDYVRPGSVPEAEQAAWANPPVAGPVPIEELTLPLHPSAFGSLLDSFYGKQFVGPQRKS